MYRKRLIPAGAVLLVLAAATVHSFLQAQTPAVRDNSEPIAAAAAAPDDAETGIAKSTADYVRAFNAADAKAAAALWTAQGEYIGLDGETVRGQAAIEKSLAEFFKSHPKAVVEVTVASVRPLGRQTAMSEGVVKLKSPHESSETRYSSLNVLEDGQWRVASVREWAPEPGQAESTKLLNWLVGEWSAQGQRGTLTIAYAWDATKTFLHGKYAMVKDGKPVSSGTQIVGLNPAGGLRSWSFDSSGTTNAAVWQRDGDRWVEEATGTLPDGLEIASVNVLIPLGPNAYSWQTTERSANGVALAPLPPIKVTRVK